MGAYRLSVDLVEVGVFVLSEKEKRREEIGLDRDGGGPCVRAT